MFWFSVLVTVYFVFTLALALQSRVYQLRLVRKACDQYSNYGECLLLDEVEDVMEEGGVRNDDRLSNDELKELIVFMEASKPVANVTYWSVIRKFLDTALAKIQKEVTVHAEVSLDKGLAHRATIIGASSFSESEVSKKTDVQSRRALLKIRATTLQDSMYSSIFLFGSKKLYYVTRYFG